MFVILSFVITLALVTLAYAQSRNFVMRRLRYVDAVQNALAPVIAGVGTAVVRSCEEYASRSGTQLLTPK